VSSPSTDPTETRNEINTTAPRSPEIQFVGAVRLIAVRSGAATVRDGLGGRRIVGPSYGETGAGGSPFAYPILISRVPTVCKRSQMSPGPMKSNSTGCPSKLEVTSKVWTFPEAVSVPSSTNKRRSENVK